MTPESIPESPDDQVPAKIQDLIATARQPATLESTFESRLLQAVKAEAAASAQRPARGRWRAAGQWWIRPRMMRAAPLVTLGLAASLAGVVCLGTLQIATRASSVAPGVASASADSVHMVRFIFVDPKAVHVALVGDFNGWDGSATPLDSSAGAWVANVPLTSGRHEYAFMVDGTRLVADPFAAPVVDELGLKSSAIMVGL